MGVLVLSLANKVEKRVLAQIATLDKLLAADNLRKSTTFILVVKDGHQKRRVVIADQYLAEVKYKILNHFEMTAISLSCAIQYLIVLGLSYMGRIGNTQLQ